MRPRTLPLACAEVRTAALFSFFYLLLPFYLGFCAPIGGESVWSVVPASAGLQGPKDPSELVLSVSSMDSASLFIQRSTGSESDMSGLVANLAALQAISSAEIPAANFSRKIIFSFFDAEAWGYGGSQRFLADVMNFTCRQFSNESQVACDKPFYPSLQFQKLDLSKVDTVFEVKQVGLVTETPFKFFIHQQQHDPNSIPAQAILFAAQQANVFAALASNSTPGLPPSSATSFGKFNLLSKTAVITDHSESYTNRHVVSPWLLCSVSLIPFQILPEQIRRLSQCQLVSSL